ncbi:hypothetical protein A9Q81_08280 [Gammaproteobacteria bacterium 42_54_T18]|nr:hypothetical protein A9Q81_08280 [Gammaproteobacteria bacterium 42_54_T18]
MDTGNKRRMQSYISTRREHPAWQLLASRTAPSVLSALQGLFEERNDGIEIELAIATLSEVLKAQSLVSELEFAGDDYSAEANKELRQWIRKGLVVERKGKISATDSLQKAFNFVDSLSNQLMTSTASRLSTVQREIENLDSNLNPNPKSRVSHIERKIRALEEELEAVKAGKFKVLAGDEAVESIREVYHLASSLRADFRRVEDSYREADKQLRESIISERKNRGDVVDKLLDSHDQLLDTAEGRVFHNFHQQLSRTIELDDMSERLKTILLHPQARNALDKQQQLELRWLKTSLVDESEAVIKARARGERDVKGFLKAGLAAEHHKVGQLLQEILSVSVDVNWSSQAIRRDGSPIPPVAFACANIPLVERLRIKELEDMDAQELDLTAQHSGLEDMDADFWSSFDSLDRQALVDETRNYLKSKGRALPLSELASHFRPKHDLETITLWLSLAREADIPITTERENFELDVGEGKYLRYCVPKVSLSTEAIQGIDLEDFEG